MATETVHRGESATAVRGRTPAVDQFYVSGEDHLRAIVYSRVTTPVRVVVTWRFWSAKRGVVQVNSDEVLSVTYPNAAIKLLALEEGVLLNVRAAAVSLAGLFYGLTYVRVQVVRGLTGAIIPLATILQGYVTTDNERAWPGSSLQAMNEGPGAIRSVTWLVSSSPLQANLVVFDATRWRIVAGSVQLTTSGVAGDRSVFLLVLDAGGNVQYAYQSELTVPASQVIRYSFGSAAESTRSVGLSNRNLAIPADLELSDSDEVEILVTNNQAGDVLTGTRVNVREWMAV